MTNYERTVSKPHQQFTPQISVCILYIAVLVATNKQWTVALLFAGSELVQFLLVLSLSTYSVCFYLKLSKGMPILMHLKLYQLVVFVIPDLTLWCDFTCYVLFLFHFYTD
jgi:hypothetical protein